MNDYVLSPDRQSRKASIGQAFEEYAILAAKRPILNNHLWGSRKPSDLGLFQDLSDDAGDSGELQLSTTYGAHELTIRSRRRNCRQSSKREFIEPPGR